MNKPFTIGELAKKSHCKVELIRYYENIGLLKASARTEGGHRLYNVAAQERLYFIRRGRELGFPIADIRELLQLSDDQGKKCASIDAIVTHHMDEIEKKRHDLARIQQELKKMLQQCPGESIDHCSVIKALAGKHP